MKCAEARERLSDYIDGLLPPGDDRLVRSHIAGCAECRAAWSDLKKTVEHIENLEDVEPPAWLTQKVMTKVKEEAGAGKGIWRKLFHPLHIKLPLEAVAATLLVATALYIFNITRGELNITGHRSAEIKESTVPSDRASGKSTVTAEQRSLEAKDAVMKEPLRTSLPEATEKKAAQGREAGANRLHYKKESVSPKSVLPGPQAPSTQAERSEVPANTATGHLGPVTRDERKEESPMTGAAPPAKEAMSQGQVKGRSLKKTEDAASAAGITGEAASVVLEVDDQLKADKEVKKVLAKLGGRLTGKEASSGGTVLRAELDSEKIGELLKQLKTAGKILRKSLSSEEHEGTVAVRIKIIKTP